MPLSVTVAPFPAAVGPIVPLRLKVAKVFFTVTVTGALVVEFPAASFAVTVNVCVPLLVCVVSHDKTYGAAVSAAPVFTPSTWNWTLDTPTLSAAVAVTFTAPNTVAPDAGAVSDMVGAVVSTPDPEPPPPPEAAVVVNVASSLTAVLPFASFECTR